MSEWITSGGTKIFGGALIVAGICHCEKLYATSAGTATLLAALLQIIKCIIALGSRAMEEHERRAHLTSLRLFHIGMDFITCLVAYYSCKGMSTSTLGFEAPAFITMLPGAAAIVFDYLGLPPHLIFGGAPIIAGICHCDMMVTHNSAGAATALAAILQLLKCIIALTYHVVREDETRTCLRWLKVGQVVTDIISFFIAVHCCNGRSTSILGFNSSAWIVMLPGLISIAFEYLGVPSHLTLGGALIVAAICHCEMTYMQKARAATLLAAILQFVKCICAHIFRSVEKTYETDDCLIGLKAAQVVLDIVTCFIAVYSCKGISTSILGFTATAFIEMLPGTFTIVLDYIG